MAIRPTLVLVLVGTFATLVFGCVRGYPSSSYFVDLKVLPASEERGIVTFSLNNEWLAWQEEKGMPIDEYGILSPYMPCSGRVSGSKIEYQAVVEMGKLKTVIFHGDKGGKIECIFAASQQSEFTIFPIIRSSSVFDDGDLEGDLNFSIPLGMPIQ